MSEETVGDISTKSIEDFQISFADLELNLNLQFVSQIQDLLQSLKVLHNDKDILENSQIMENNVIIMELLSGNVTNDKEKDFNSALKREKDLGLLQSKDVIQRQFTAVHLRRKHHLKGGDISDSNSHVNILTMSKF